MYHYIRGMVVKRNLNNIIVENNGIGYEIQTSMQTVSEVEENSEAKIYTKLIVKDEEVILIGFSSVLELEVFELLKTVSGVGIKSSLNILSTINLTHLISSVIDEDVKILMSVSGIGKKSAQRIIIELKDKFIKKYQNHVEENNASFTMNNDSLNHSSKRNDVKMALESLGYSSSEINHVLQQLDLDSMDIEVLIKEGLKLLLKG
ncbi:MAG: Holliday junction branch migration protein RuvA [Clostridiales bacterium]|nr:Holliday junction branch migration protein RuvA [Clostridiales bacterium]